MAKVTLHNQNLFILCQKKAVDHHLSAIELKDRQLGAFPKVILFHQVIAASYLFLLLVHIQTFRE